MGRWPVLAATAAVVTLAAAPGVGGDETWLTRKHGTGGWDGLRRQWLDDGIVPGGFYVFDVQRNPTGGLDQKTAYAGHAEIGLSLNLDRLLGAGGLAFDVAVSWSTGSNLSDDIGNVFQVGEAYSGQTVQLSRLYLEQTLADGSLFLKLGRISAGNDFAVLPASVFYVNAGTNGSPLSVPLNEPGFFTDPVAQWGLRLLYRPSDRIHLRLAAYNADPTIGDEGEHGLDFSFNPADGVLTMFEIAYNPMIPVQGEGYRGTYKVGGFYDSSDFQALGGPATTLSPQIGLYLVAQQEVFREGAGPSEIAFRPFFGRHIVRTQSPIHVTSVHQGLTPWVAISWSPKQEISTMPFYAAGGLLYRGLFENRENDHTAFGVHYGKFSDHLPGRGSELVLEFNYGIQLTPWFYLTPDLQYVVNPGGATVPDAWVIGIESGITF